MDNCFFFLLTDPHSHVLFELQRHHPLYHKHGRWRHNYRELSVRREASLSLPRGGQVWCRDRAWGLRHPLSPYPFHRRNCGPDQQNACCPREQHSLGQPRLRSKDPQVHRGEARPHQYGCGRQAPSHSVGQCQMSITELHLFFSRILIYCSFSFFFFLNFFPSLNKQKY